MKVYCFTLKVKEFNKSEYPACSIKNIIYRDGKDICFYGFTSKKEIAMEFADSRIFDCHVSTMSKHDYSIFEERYSECLIERHNINHKIIKHGKYSTGSISMLLTSQEYDMCVYRREETIGNIFTDIFSESFIELAMTSGFNFNKRLTNELNNIYLMDMIFRDMSPIEDFNMGMYNINELGLVLYLFGNTFK